MTHDKHRRESRSRRARAPRTQADLVVTLSGLAATIAIVDFVLTGSDSLQGYGAPWLLVLAFLLVGAATAMLALVGLGYRLAKDSARARRRRRPDNVLGAGVVRGPTLRDPDARRLLRSIARRGTTDA